MKKFFSNIIFYVIIAVVILVPLAIAFQDVFDVILKIGGGSILKGIILLPFAVLGFINAFRGFGAVLEMDEAKYGHLIKRNWQLGIYFILYIGGYFAMYYVIIKCF